mmetsp:Transcript_3661/g.12045  ORF Transcript_3661/g.12045 Transcript_3661/m.12045 type:complete len:486 (+) Transcript_3661:263-1720(+)
MASEMAQSRAPAPPVYSEGPSSMVEFDVGRAMALRQALRLQGPEEVRAKAWAFKQEANRHFTTHQSPAIALKGYLTALWLLRADDLPFPEFLATSSPEIPKGERSLRTLDDGTGEGDDLRTQLLLNAGFCCLKLRDPDGAVALSGEAHRRSPSAKSALRLAKAEEGRGDYDAAAATLADFASHPVCRRELELLRKRKKDEQLLSAKMLRGLQKNKAEDEEAREPGRPPKGAPSSDDKDDESVVDADAQGQQRLASPKKKKRAEEKVVIDLSAPDAQEKLAKLQARQDRGVKAMKRISPADARELMALRSRGAPDADLARFYAEARDREACRVGAKMTDKQKLTFATFCNTPGVTEDQIDAAFDDIRNDVDNEGSAGVAGVAQRLETEQDERKEQEQASSTKLPEELPEEHGEPTSSGTPPPTTRDLLLRETKPLTPKTEKPQSGASASKPPPPASAAAPRNTPRLLVAVVLAGALCGVLLTRKRR